MYKGKVMQVNFNPSATHAGNSQVKKRTPAFGSVNQEWLKIMENEGVLALNTVIRKNHLPNQKNPIILKNIQDTMQEAEKQGYIVGEKCTEAWHTFMERYINPYIN